MSFSFLDLALAIVASHTGRDPAFAARVDSWVQHFGHTDITTLTTYDVEDGVDALINAARMYGS
jgi:hypothetical protein